MNKSKEYIVGLVVTGAVDNMMALSSERPPLVGEVGDSSLKRMNVNRDYRTGQTKDLCVPIEDCKRVEDGQTGRFLAEEVDVVWARLCWTEWEK